MTATTEASSDTAGSARAPARRSRRSRRTPAPIGFLAPFLVLFALFFLIPIGYAVYESLFATKVSGLGLAPPVTKFVGLSNYSSVFGTASFIQGIERVLLFGIVQVPVMLAFATLLALLIDSVAARFTRFFRLAFFLPYGIPGVIAAILWSFLYLPNLSPIDSVLKSLHFGSVSFLGSHTVLWSIANIVTWEYTGYNMLIIFAGLQAIPRELFEAARVDGASEWKIATRVKLPLVVPSLVLTSVFSIIGTLQLFSEPQVLRAISTNIVSTYTPNLSAYNEAFTLNNPNLAAAMAVVLAIGTFILSFGFLRLTSRRSITR
ncbi:MAG: carbohydrate ABC transporter permease [Acidimicrobiales bacterium]